MAKIDVAVLGKYAALGAGAVAVPAIVSNVEMLSAIMANQIMQAGFAGITVGGVLMAGIGILAIDQLVYSKGY